MSPAQATPRISSVDLLAHAHQNRTRQLLALLIVQRAGDHILDRVRDDDRAIGAELRGLAVALIVLDEAERGIA